MSKKAENIFNPKKSIQIHGQLMQFDSPKIMGILNITPDSFYAGSRYLNADTALEQCRQMIAEGVHIIDVGGVSTRPNAEKISEKEELKRVLPVIKQIRKTYPQIPVSIDTHNAKVAEKCVEAGANMVNDISAGRLDKRMFKTIAQLNVPYVLMHMQGTPQNMQAKPGYKNVVADIAALLQQKSYELATLGVKDIIWDVGFGFGKTVTHNFSLLKHLNYFTEFGFALMAGVSRKSMICKTLSVQPKDALFGSISAQTLAIQNGANIIRTHDIKATVQALKIVESMRQAP